jgi:hypothetical protein
LEDDMSEANGHDAPLEIVGALPQETLDRLPDAVWLLGPMIDALHVFLDALSCDDPRHATLPFARDIECAIDRLADIRAHLRAAYPSKEW